MAGRNQHSSPAPKAPKKRKGKKRSKKIITVLVVILVLLCLALAALVGVLVLKSRKKNPDKVTLNTYTTTPTEQKSKVAYYVIGLLGAEEKSDMEMLSLVCHDKEKNALTVLEVPQDTYLGNDKSFAVKKAASVFANPKSLNWCEFCGQHVYDAEIEDNKHNICGHAITQKTGSSTGNLMAVFNESYAMYTDNYFLFSQPSLVKLVNLMGGVSVKLDSKMTLAGTEYKAGEQTLTGNEALAYMLQRDSGTKGDIVRIQRQRRVMLALLQRVTKQPQSALKLDNLVPMQKGSTPIRTNLDNDELLSLVAELASVKPEAMTNYILPGEATTSNSMSYYSVHRADTVKLLNEAFNPYGKEIGEGDVQITELSRRAKTDTHKQSMAEIAVGQDKQHADEVTTVATTA